jgi:polyferredoxin
MFVDHQYVPSPMRQLMVHEYLESPKILDVALPDGLPVPVFGCYYPCGRTATCALWEIQAYIYPFWEAQDGWGVEYNSLGITRLVIVVGLIMLMAIVFGRFVCGWICPFGLYMDLLTRLRKFLKIKHKDLSESFNERFHQFGYIVLALIVVVCVVLGSEAIFGAQLIPGTEDGGFVYQYFSAPFCQVCPMKPLCVLSQGAAGIIKPEWIFEVTTGDFWELGYYITSINLIIFGAVTVTSFYYRRLWCRICPLGALIALFNRFPPFKQITLLRLDKVEEKCTKCGICKRVCPTQVTEVYEEIGGDVTNSKCIMCLRCIEMCPEKDALKLKLATKPIIKSRNWLK